MLSLKEFEDKLDTYKEFENYLDELDNVGVSIWQQDSIGNFETAYIDTLEQLMEDEDHYISYFVFECDFGLDDEYDIIDEEGKELPFRTVKDLYNVLLSKYHLRCVPEEDEI